MNRESVLRMGAIPQIDAKRSKFDLSCTVKTTFINGDIVPLKVIEVLPGDTIECDLAGITRMATPIFPVMDNLILDCYAFFVPDRLLWNHWEEFWGQNDDPWTQTTEYLVPKVESPNGGWTVGTLADYMGIPTYIDKVDVNALYFRAYAKIFSDWFRDENLQYVAHMYDDDTDRTGSNGGNYITDCELGGKPAKACKTKDYFTGCLPEPQKGPSVALPLGTQAPVGAGTTEWDLDDNVRYAHKVLYRALGAEGQWASNPIPLGNYQFGFPADGTQIKYGSNSALDTQSTMTNFRGMAPTNLFADLKNATAATISQLRTAFAIQRYYEQAARGGSRYIEFLKSVFSVSSSDARLQRSEYIGGFRQMINMDQIIQTSSTDSTTPQGNPAGFSVTHTKESLFTKSFEEHGILMFLLVARIDEHTYQQGLEKKFTRRKWTDYYNPFFAHLSEMPVECKNIYCQGNAVVDSDGNIIDNKVFGYQEAYAEYRYENNIVTGYMRSNVPGGGLDAMHYADDYNALPSLGADWIKEGHAEVDRTIAVSADLAHQIYGDYRLNIKAIRVMPVFGYPGLIDHV